MLLNLIKSRSRLIKVEAIETPAGITVGSHVRTIAFKQLDGDFFPVVTGTVRSVTYYLDYSLSYYRLAVDCDPGQSIRSVESAEHNFERILNA